MSRLVTGTPPLVRVVNRRLILDRVRRMGRASRAELAKVTAIRPPTVSAVIKQLTDEGLVEEVGEGETNTGTGRPPRMVALSRRRPRAIGFEVSGSAILAGLCHLDGTLAAQTEVAHAPATPDVTVRRLYGVGSEFLAGAGVGWSDLEGVGIAVPGLVAGEQGLVRWSRPFDWHEVALQQICEAQWGTRTDVVNNFSAGGMAAHFFGAGQEAKSLVYLYVRFDVVESHASDGTDETRAVVRLGSGILINGEPYHGNFGAAGEITTLVKHPCAEVGSGRGRPYADMSAFVTAFNAGEVSARRLFDRVAKEVGVHVMHAINFVDPGMVVIDSDYPVLRDELVPRLQRIVDQDALREVVGKTAVAASSLGEFGIARGAVVPALQRLFRVPRLGPCV